MAKALIEPSLRQFIAPLDLHAESAQAFDHDRGASGPYWASGVADARTEKLGPTFGRALTGVRGKRDNAHHERRADGIADHDGLPS